VTSAHPFRISLRGAGAFPSANRPRTIWIGVDQGADQLQKLQKAVEDGVKKLGFPRERRSFHPHLTIGRIRRGGPELQELSDRLLQQESYDAGSATIDQVVVYASYLEKSGPTYSAMSRIPLTGSD
jgi:2'-5' RNA ligase